MLGAIVLHQRWGPSECLGRDCHPASDPLIRRVDRLFCCCRVHRRSDEGRAVRKGRRKGRQAGRELSSLTTSLLFFFPLVFLPPHRSEQLTSPSRKRSFLFRLFVFSGRAKTPRASVTCISRPKKWKKYFEIFSKFLFQLLWNVLLLAGWKKIIGLHLYKIHIFSMQGSL